eukprot:scpid48112/ scgid13380/ 
MALPLTAINTLENDPRWGVDVRNVLSDTLPHDQFKKSVCSVFCRYASFPRGRDGWLDTSNARRAFAMCGLRLTYGQIVDMLDSARKCPARVTCCGRLLPEYPCLKFSEFYWFVGAYSRAYKQRQRASQCAEARGESAGHILSTLLKPQLHSHAEVFLGGACNPTVWRATIAMPFLTEKDITFYNPQVDVWHEDLIAEERVAKRQAKINLLVIGEETRAVASLVEAAFMCAENVGVVPVVRMTYRRSQILHVTHHKTLASDELDALLLTEREVSELNYARSLLIDYAESRGIRVYSDLGYALTCIHDVLKLEEGCVSESVVKWEDACVRLGGTILDSHQHFVEADRKWIAQQDYPLSVSSMQIKNEILQQLGQAANRREFELNIPISYIYYCEYLVLSTTLRWIGFRLDEQKAQKEEKEKSITIRHRSASHVMMDYVRDGIAWVSNNILNKNNTVWPLRTRMTSLLASVVYLGGSCGRTTWRKDIAIPYLEKKGIFYDNPQAAPGAWSIDRIPNEINRLRAFKYLLFVITSHTRSVASLVDAAFHIGKGQHCVVVCIEDIPQDCIIEGERLNKVAVKDYNRGRAYLRDLCRVMNVPMYTSILQAVKSCVSLVSNGYPTLDTDDEERDDDVTGSNNDVMTTTAGGFHRRKASLDAQFLVPRQSADGKVTSFAASNFA